MEHDEYRHNNSAPDSSSASRPARWAVPVLIALVGVAALGVGYGFRQAGLVSQMTARQNESNAEATQMRAQIDSLNSKLNDVLGAQQQQQLAREPQAAQRSAKQGASGRGAGTASGSSKQISQLRAQLSDQQKQLQDTREALDKTRTDLETSLSATRDDLNSSIARTHEEVVALAKRGERSYFEFDLTKNAGFERSGPVALSLRKADTKHQRFDVNLIVEDAQLSKKSVNLYEPIWLNRVDDPQPVQIVINKITKDHVHGYVSAPKYRQSELTNASYTPSLNRAPSNPPTAPASASPDSRQTAPPPNALPDRDTPPN